MKIVFARDLRVRQILLEIPSNKPGWYRWWAPEKALELLLNSHYINNKHLSVIRPYLTKQTWSKTDYYFIYTGIAVKDSIQNRLNWHINQHHTKSSVESGFLSTFRKTISSLVAGNQYDEDATNVLIDMLLVEYCSLDYPIKSDKAKEDIEKIEDHEMANNYLPLNIRGNKKPELRGFLNELKEARRTALC